MGGKLTTHVTAPLAAAGTAAVKTASDFDSAMSKVAAVSGATGDDLDKLRDKAREMGSKTKFSASEAAEAMNYMAMAGWKTGDMLSGIDGIMNLAAASGEDLATTSDIVTDALTAFGLSAADSGHFADVLASASSNANVDKPRQHRAAPGVDDLRAGAHQLLPIIAAACGADHFPRRGHPVGPAIAAHGHAAPVFIDDIRVHSVPSSC